MIMIYAKNMKNLRNIILSNMMEEITQYQICGGSHNEKVLQLSEQHVVPQFQSNSIY